MPKQRTGYVYYDEKRKAWTARLIYKDDFFSTPCGRRQIFGRVREVEEGRREAG
jgi:hypothetical protein